jgi:uncharacterized membrane protein YbhN (UPF0104 family)
VNISSPLVRRIAKIGATLILLAVLFWTLDAAKLADAVFRIQPIWMAAGVALCGLFVATRMAKWIVLTRGNNLSASTSMMVRSMLFALALGIVTPGRVGEVVAIFPFPVAERGKALFAYLYDRLGELSMVILFCVPATIVFLPGWGLLIAVCLLAGTAGAVATMESRRLRLWVIRRLPRRTPRRLGEILAAPIRAPARYWLVSGVSYLLAYASVAAFIAGAEPIPSLRALLVLPVVTLSNLVTITVGGLGVREGLAALVSPAAGLTPEVTAGAFFLSFFWTRMVPGLIGLLLAHFTGYGFAPREEQASQSGKD